MNCFDIERILGLHKETLTALHVRSLSVFGSVARNEAGPDSDVDMLVEFDKASPVGLFHFIAVKQFLEKILQRPVDLGTSGSLRASIRDDALKDAIRVA